MINCGYKAIPHSFLDHFHFMRGGAKLSFRPRFSLAKIFTYLCYSRRVNVPIYYATSFSFSSFWKFHWSNLERQMNESCVPIFSDSDKVFLVSLFYNLQRSSLRIFPLEMIYWGCHTILFSWSSMCKMSWCSHYQKRIVNQNHIVHSIQSSGW